MINPFDALKWGNTKGDKWMVTSGVIKVSMTEKKLDIIKLMELYGKQID